MAHFYLCLSKDIYLNWLNFYRKLQSNYAMAPVGQFSNRLNFPESKEYGRANDWACPARIPSFRVLCDIRPNVVAWLPGYL